jgi:cysteine desulfurase family protein (TIGR01976 family)
MTEKTAPHPTTETSIASVEAIRTQFPALKRSETGHPVAYFDGPGGTQVPQAVVDAVAEYLLHHNANSHWSYPTSVETDAALSAARQALADFVGGAPSEIVFGANMTTLTYHLSRALAPRLDPGDEIVVTELDHQANIAPWTRLVAERGVRVVTVPMLPESGTLDWDSFETLVTPRTRLVAVGAASNALGTINDVARAVDLAHAVGALAFVDAVHYAAHAKVDVKQWNCDFLSCSAYKFYGPHVGMLWGREDLLTDLDVPKLDPAPNTAPDRCETGTQNHEGIVGAAAAVDFLASLADSGDRSGRLESSLNGLHLRGEKLFDLLWRGLAAIPGTNLFGPRPGQARTPTLGFTLGSIPSQRVAAALAADHGLFVSDGDFYASSVTAALGVAEQGLIRIGCACYTTADEIDRLIAAVRTLSSI